MKRPRSSECIRWAGLFRAPTPIASSYHGVMGNISSKRAAVYTFALWLLGSAIAWPLVYMDRTSDLRLANPDDPNSGYVRDMGSTTMGMGGPEEVAAYRARIWRTSMYSGAYWGLLPAAFFLLVWWGSARDARQHEEPPPDA